MTDDFYLANLDLLQHLVRDHRESLLSISHERWDRGFFLYGQMVSFLHRILRRILPQRILSQKDGWDGLKSFGFLGKEMLENEQFMLKTSFCDRPF